MPEKTVMPMARRTSVPGPSDTSRGAIPAMKSGTGTRLMLHYQSAPEDLRATLSSLRDEARQAIDQAARLSVEVVPQATFTFRELA